MSLSKLKTSHLWPWLVVPVLVWYQLDPWLPSWPLLAVWVSLFCLVVTAPAKQSWYLWYSLALGLTVNLGYSGIYGVWVVALVAVAILLRSALGESAKIQPRQIIWLVGTVIISLATVWSSQIGWASLVTPALQAAVFLAISTSTIWLTALPRRKTTISRI